MSKLKKIISFFILSFIINLSSFASIVTINEAEQIAEAKILQHSKYSYTILNSEKISNKDLVLFYAFNLKPVGYIIVPADDNMNPVIAYSFISNIDEKGVFINFLKNDIQKRYDAITELPDEVINKRKNQRYNLIHHNFNKEKFEQWPPEGSTSTGGWLETNWHQNAPYYNMCPIDPSTSNRSLAGCPSVAMAMILNYHKTINNTVFSDEDDYYHNYAGRTYWIDNDWEENGFPSFPDLNKYLDTLTNHYENKEPLTDNDKAALTFACGVAATQVYTSGGSGTFGVNQAFDAYIKFSCNNVQLLHDTDEGIFDSLTQNMKDALPAHLAVVNESWTSGHNVVVDGYNTDGYYHINFGWGGSNNGWYIIPDEIPYSLTVIEGLIVDIMKPEANKIEFIEKETCDIYPNPIKRNINKKGNNKKQFFC